MVIARPVCIAGTIANLKTVDRFRERRRLQCEPPPSVHRDAGPRDRSNVDSCFRRIASTGEVTLT
jgi:hypothetical protein